MLVKHWMTKDVVWVEDDASMMETSQIMREKKVRLVPVLSKGKLVGIVSDRDIKAASPSKATTLDVHELYYLLSKLSVKDVMTKQPFTITEDETVERAAVIMLDKHISGLPVLDESDKLVGVLTQGDVFRVLTAITGVFRGGYQFAFELEDRSGSMREVADVIRSHGGRLTSALALYDRAPKGYRTVFLRASDLDDDKVPGLVEELKSRFKFLYHVKNEKVIYS
ncbi:MAG: CBS and ACT domain-containing protein [Proteobacteria bacterium]|nr:CBS and ACT domain-containing protein [Pseudomonadota bacterium]